MISCYCRVYLVGIRNFNENKDIIKRLEKLKYIKRNIDKIVFDKNNKTIDISMNYAELVKESNNLSNRLIEECKIPIENYYKEVTNESNVNESSVIYKLIVEDIFKILLFL